MGEINNRELYLDDIKPEMLCRQLSGSVKLADGYTIWSPGEESGERYTFRSHIHTMIPMR